MDYLPLPLTHSIHFLGLLFYFWNSSVAGNPRARGVVLALCPCSFPVVAFLLLGIGMREDMMSVGEVISIGFLFVAVVLWTIQFVCDLFVFSHSLG